VADSPARPGEDLSAIDPSVIEHMSDSVIEDEATPHLRQTVQSASRSNSQHRRSAPMAWLAMAISTVGMLVVFMGVMTVVAGVGGFLHSGIEEVDHAAVVILLGLSLGVGLGLALVAGGALLLGYVRRSSSGERP
jgi:hypothetical protein